jgi:hypothetical protein
MRPATPYLLATLALCFMGVAAIVYLEAHRPEGFNTAVYGQLAAIIVPTLTLLLTLLKSAANGQAIEEVKQLAADAREKAEASVKETVRGNRQVAELKQTVESAVADGGGRGP